MTILCPRDDDVVRACGRARPTAVCEKRACNRPTRFIIVFPRVRLRPDFVWRFRNASVESDVYTYADIAIRAVLCTRRVRVCIFHTLPTRVIIHRIHACYYRHYDSFVCYNFISRVITKKKNSSFYEKKKIGCQ